MFSYPNAEMDKLQNIKTTFKIAHNSSECASFPLNLTEINYLIWKVSEMSVLHHILDF